MCHVRIYLKKRLQYNNINKYNYNIIQSTDTTTWNRRPVLHRSCNLHNLYRCNGANKFASTSQFVDFENACQTAMLVICQGWGSFVLDVIVQRAGIQQTASCLIWEVYAEVKFEKCETHMPMKPLNPSLLHNAADPLQLRHCDDCCAEFLPRRSKRRDLSATSAQHRRGAAP